jgi:hypothetical protein
MERSEMMHNQISRGPDNKVAEVHLHITKDSLPGLMAVLHHALNTWPEAPAEWKVLWDLLEHGRILQEYDDEREARRIKESSDYHSLEVREKIASLIKKFGQDEYIAYTLTSHEVSLDDWQKKMIIKYPDKCMV